MEAINTISNTRQFDLSSMVETMGSGAADRPRSSSVQMFSTEHTEGGHGPVQQDDTMGMRRPMHADHANGAHHAMSRDAEAAGHDLKLRNAERAAGLASDDAALDAIAGQQTMAPPTGGTDASQNGAGNMAAQQPQATAPAGAADGAQNGASNAIGEFFQTVMKGLQGLLSAVIPGAGQALGMLSPLMGMLSPMLGKPATGGTGTA
ncbi:hypothetical protein P0D71_27580 [Paraburkholderia sp. RL17-383-BIF-A]|uniref:hypothetical protein n=1 Tax=Paraburkholderia sp. RL17-383-BIF-A TaxID=3031631 RepID=UPI0038BB9331